MDVILQVSCSGVRSSAKNTDVFYAEFQFFGGVFNLMVDASASSLLKKTDGKMINAKFELKPKQIVSFDRPQTVFEPSRLISFDGNK